MQVHTPKGRWLVPPQRAVWIPSLTEHSIEILTELEMRSVYIETALVLAHPAADKLEREFVVTVGKLLRSLVLSLFRPSAHEEHTKLLLGLILFELLEDEDPTTFLPMPVDPRARRVAALAIEDIEGYRTLPDLAHIAGVSQRTIARIFPLETHLTFKKWRQRARMMAAIEELGVNRVLIKQVAATLGYSSVAAFTAAFHEVFGITPTEFQERSIEE